MDEILFVILWGSKLGKIIDFKTSLRIYILFTKHLVIKGLKINGVDSNIPAVPIVTYRFL